MRIGLSVRRVEDLPQYGSWYTALPSRQIPAYKHLTESQLEQAIALAHAIIAQPDECLRQLNQNSLGWRGRLSQNDF